MSKLIPLNPLKKKALIVTTILLLIYLAILLRFILFKDSYAYLYNHFSNGFSWYLIEKKYTTANFIPFATIYYYLSGQDTTGTWSNLLGNIVLFIPFGFLIPLLLPKIKHITQIFIAAFLSSLFFEMLQLLLALGTFDIDDCILNSTGAIIGFLIYSIWKKYIPAIS